MGAKSPLTHHAMKKTKTRSPSTNAVKEENKKTKNALVFAKLEGFRWWPALVLGNMKKGVRRMDEHTRKRLKLPKGKKSREECHLVRFHGTGDVSLLSKDKVCEFNEESFKLYASGGFAGESLEEMRGRLIEEEPEAKPLSSSASPKEDEKKKEEKEKATTKAAKKPSRSAFQKAVEEAVKWERENENGDASSSDDDSDDSDDDEGKEEAKEAKEEDNAKKGKKATDDVEEEEEEKVVRTTTKTKATPTKDRKKKDVEVNAAVAATTAAEKNKETKKKEKKGVDEKNNNRKKTGGAAAERRESGGKAATSTATPPATTLNKKKTTTSTTRKKKEEGVKQDDEQGKQEEKEKKTEEDASLLGDGGKRKRGGTASPRAEVEEKVDVKREEPEEVPAKPLSSSKEENKEEEEELKAPPAPASPPPPLPPPPLPLEPTKTWLEFSPIEASSFDASMVNDQENATTIQTTTTTMTNNNNNNNNNNIAAVVSIAPNEDIEQSSIVVQNEQMQLEEAHLNRARLTRNQRNNNTNTTTNNNNNNNNNNIIDNNNKKKARGEQQQRGKILASSNNYSVALLETKKSVSFAKQEKIVSNSSKGKNKNNINDDDVNDDEREAFLRGANADEKAAKTLHRAMSTTNNACLTSAVGAPRAMPQHFPRGGGAVAAGAAAALDSRFYKSCHQCQQQHVASPCEFGGAKSSNNSINNNNNTDNNNNDAPGKNDTGNQHQAAAASKCCGVSFCDQCVEKFYSHLTRSQCRKKCPKCRGLCNCRLCLRKEDVVGKSSSSYSSKSNTNNATTTIASLFEDSENLALASLEATLDISERKKRASYCLVAMEKAFARSAECDAWEIEREEKKKKEEEKQSNNRNSNTSSSPPSDEDEDEDNDEDDEKSDDVNDESERNNNKKKRKKSNFLSTTVPSGAFCDACANDIVAVCLSCDECDVRVCAYCISTLRKGTEAPYVERVCCLSHDDVARAKIKAEMSRRILSEKPPAAETKNATTKSSIAAAAAQKGSSKDSPLLRVNNPSPSAAQNQQREDTSKSTKNNDENDSALLPMKKRLKMAFKTLNSSFTDGSDDELEKRSSPAQPTSAHHSQDHQQQRKQKEEEEAAAAAAALKIAKKSKLEDDITCVACDGAMKVDLRMYDFKRVKEATHVAKKESSSFFSKVDKNGNDDESAEECPYCKMETIEENVRVSSFGKGKETKIWTPDQKELLKAEKSALHANDAKQYNEFIAHFRYHWLRGDPVVVRNVETEMSWDPSVIERAMRDPNIASMSSSSAAAGFGNLGGGGGVGVGGSIGGGDNDLNSSGAYAACFQHDAVVPVFACGADEYDELAKTKKTSTTPVKGGTSMTTKSSNDTSALQGKKEDAPTTQLGKEKKKKKILPKAASTNTPKFSMALKDFFAGFFDPLLTFDGKLFQLRDFPRCIGGNRMNLKEVLPKHFRRLLAALPFRLYTNPEVGTINLFALQFQKYVLGGGGGGTGENFFQGVSSNSRSRGDVAAKKFVESLVKASFSYGNGTRTYVEGKSSIETFGVGSADDVCSVNVYSSTSFSSTDDKTIALWTVIRPQDADEVLRRVEEHEDIEEDALYLSDDALEKALLLPREDDKSKSKSIECFAFAQNEKECVLLPGGSLRQILNVRSNCRADVKFSSPEHCHGCNLLLFDDNINDDDFERRRVTVLKAAKACADVVLHPFAEEEEGKDEEEEENE